MWERELIDEKVDDDCTIIRKNKIRAETRVQFFITFHHVTLITTNEKFSSRANRSARTLNLCLYPPSYKLEVGAWPTISECRIYLKGFTQKVLGRSWARRLTELN